MAGANALSDDAGQQYSDLPPGAVVVSAPKPRAARPQAAYADLPEGATLVHDPSQRPMPADYPKGAADPGFTRDYSAWWKSYGAPRQQAQIGSDEARHPVLSGALHLAPNATRAAINAPLGVAEGAGIPLESTLGEEAGAIAHSILAMPGNLATEAWRELSRAGQTLNAAEFGGPAPAPTPTDVTAAKREAKPGVANKLAGGAEEVASGVPLVGPGIAHGIETTARGVEQRDPGAIARGVANLGTQGALALAGGTKEGREASKGAISTVGGPIERAARAGIEKAQAATVPAADASLFRAVRPINSRSNAMADLQVAGPELQRWSQETGTPIRNAEDLRNAIPEAKKQVWQEYEAIAGPHAKAAIDGNQVADAMLKSIDKRTRQADPELAARIEKQAEAYRRPLTLDEAEEFLQGANNVLSSYYAKSKVGRGVAEHDPATGYLVAEAGALRKALYDRLGELTGQDAAAIKKRYGALSNLQDMIERRRNVALRNSPVGAMDSLGRIAGIGRVVKGVFAHPLNPDLGEAAAGIAQAALGHRLSQFNNTDWLIDNAFNGPRAFEPNVRVVYQPEVVTPRGALGPGATPMGPGPDASYVRGVPGRYGVAEQPPRVMIERALPEHANQAPGVVEMGPGEDRSELRVAPARKTVAREPNGRFRVAYTGETEPRTVGMTGEGGAIREPVPAQGAIERAAAGGGRGTRPLLSRAEIDQAIHVLNDPNATALEKQAAREKLASDPSALRLDLTGFPVRRIPGGSR